MIHGDDRPVMRSTPETPTEYQLKVTSDAAYLRGAMVTSYAQVEFLLADLVMRCMHRPEYASINDRFPYKLEDRIKAVRKIFRADGPLEQYRGEVEEVADGLLRFEQVRHFLSHGMLLVQTYRTEWHRLTYRMYRPAKGSPGSAEAGIMETDLAQLEFTVRDIASYSQRFVELWRRIYLDQGLEPVS